MAVRSQRPALPPRMRDGRARGKAEGAGFHRARRPRRPSDRRPARLGGRLRPLCRAWGLSASAGYPRQRHLWGGPSRGGGLSIALLPLFTRVLSPVDYGALDILTVFASFAGVVVAL